MQEQDTADLILELSVEPRGAVGYGTVFVGDVRRAVKGSVKTNTIRITVLAADRATEAFLTSHKAPAVVEVGFKKDKENEPYGMMPITGFVDENKTSWRLIYAK